MDCPTLKDRVVLLHSCRRRYAVFIVEVNIVRVVLSDLSRMTGYFRVNFSYSKNHSNCPIPHNYTFPTSRKTV